MAMWIIIFGILLLVIISSISNSTENQLAATRELWRLADPEGYALDEKRRRHKERMSAWVTQGVIMVIGLSFWAFFWWAMTRTN
jgi:uncharacterized protein YpmB